MKIKIFSFLFIILAIIPVRAERPRLVERLLEIIGPDRIGVAVIFDDGDTIALDGNRRFPMMSVAKFHQALAIADYLGFPAVMTDSISIESSDLMPGTWSPLRAANPEGLTISLPHLLHYSLNMSDNNAADVFFNHFLSPQQTDSIVKYKYGIGDFNVAATEAQMHADNSLALENYSTPLSAARLFDKFFTADTTSAGIVVKAVMSTPSSFGNDRIRAGIPEGKAMVFHKTGTGFDLPGGGISALADVGYITYVRPDGQTGYYTLAVFVRDFEQAREVAIEKIARISEAVWNATVEDRLIAMNNKAFVAPGTKANNQSPDPEKPQAAAILLGITGAFFDAVLDNVLWGEDPY